MCWIYVCFVLKSRCGIPVTSGTSPTSLPRAGVVCRPPALKQAVRLAQSSVLFSSGGSSMESGCLWTLNSGESEREGLKNKKANQKTRKPPRPRFPAEPLIAWQYESFPQASTTTWPQMGVNGKDGSSGQTTETDSQPCQRAPDLWMSAWDTDGCFFSFF